MLFVCKYVLLFILVARVMIQVAGCKLLYEARFTSVCIPKRK